jgi:hypothetical protein
MAAEPTKLEAMMVHLLNERGPNGRPWAAIAVPGYPKFTRDDTEAELRVIRQVACDACKAELAETPTKRWWEFWKP